MKKYIQGKCAKCDAVWQIGSIWDIYDEKQDSKDIHETYRFLCETCLPIVEKKKNE